MHQQHSTPTLQYEPLEAQSRPWWVYIVAGVYASLLLGILALAIWMPTEDNQGYIYVLTATLIVLLLCAASLILVPVRAARRRPLSPIALWVPLLASAILAGLLVFGGVIAWLEYAYVDAAWPAFVAGGIVWAMWTLVFGLLAWRRSPQRVVNTLHRWILAGSVLELLVAVPTHVVVRRRDECCAGIATGLGICIGIAVMIVAFGPSVALLYYRRWKQISPKTGGSHRDTEAQRPA